MSGADSRVDWDAVHDRLIEDFKESRDSASASIARMRKLMDAFIVCRPPVRVIKPEDFAVNDLVNELKTVERYIKREMARLAQKENGDD